MADIELDARGLVCPMPLLLLKKALAKVPVGGTVWILMTDPAAPDDLRAFCDLTGQEELSRRTEGDVYTMEIRRMS